MADHTPSLPRLEEQITAKAIAAVQLLLEDAIDGWERTISQTGTPANYAAVLAVRLERARELAAEMQALAQQMAQRG